MIHVMNLSSICIFLVYANYILRCAHVYICVCKIFTLLYSSSVCVSLQVVHSRRESDAGTYWCEAHNELGTVRSRNATLQVASKYIFDHAKTTSRAGGNRLLSQINTIGKGGAS